MVAELVADAYKSIRWEKPLQRHVYHREVLPDLAALACRVSESVLESALSGSGSPWDRELLTLADVAELRDRLEVSAVKAMIRSKVDHYGAIADDPIFLIRSNEVTEQYDSYDGKSKVTRTKSVFVVQHQASGLRAQFTLPDEDNQFGVVHSKSYEICSIDEDHAHYGMTAVNCDQYYRLGIGLRLVCQRSPTRRLCAMGIRSDG